MKFGYLSALLVASRCSDSFAEVACETDDICIEKLRLGSQCVGGYCTNPFVSGCLRQHLGEEKYPNVRVCNSDDPSHFEEEGLCSNEPLHYLDYMEIRIAPADWDSAIFLAWLHQIILTEVMNVPVSIESGEGRVPGASLSFYDMNNNYGDKFPVTSYSVEGLQKANQIGGDCRETDEPCAHVLPEVWPGTDPIERSADVLFTGQMGIEGFWMPSYTIEKDPSLGTYYGLSGEKNREKLAKIFKRPTTWGDYCKHVTNCTSDDGIAARSPVDESESGRYFVEGLYTGFFRDTEKNDCLLNPNCTGHVVDYPCSWKPFTEQQLFWNDIPLESDNSGEHYSGGSLKEIFYAANATKSDIMAVWWKPDPTFDQFDYIRVSFPFPSSDCIENRRPTVDRCTASHGELVGNKKGACDLGILPLEKFVATSLQENVFSTPIDTRSPSYQFISSFTFQNIQVEQLLQSWYSRNVDRYGYDPREAVCEYVAQNLDKLMAFVPRGHPRQVGKTNDVNYYEDLLPIISIAFGALSALIMLLTFGGTFYFHDHKVMKSAQISYLYLFCLGYLLVSVGAILLGMLPNDAICVAREWFVLVGYTLALAPLAVKVTAIYRLVRQAQSMRRCAISQKNLILSISLLVSIALVFLTIWTVLDPPTKAIDMVLQENTENVVDAHIRCSTEHSFWGGGSLGWQGILIFYCFVLAWQARVIMKKKKIAELQMVRNMAYASFLVFVFRSVIFYLPDEAISPEARACTESLLLSLDSILSIIVYFGPKFLMIRSAVDTDDAYTASNFEQEANATECPQCGYHFCPTATESVNNSNKHA